MAKVNVFALKSLSPNASCYMKSNKSVKPVGQMTNKHM